MASRWRGPEYGSLSLYRRLRPLDCLTPAGIRPEVEARNLSTGINPTRGTPGYIRKHFFLVAYAHVFQRL
jgi:hypothetical protein